MPTSHSENKNNGTNSFGCEYLARLVLTQVAGRSKCQPLRRRLLTHKFGIVSVQPKYANTGTSQFPSGKKHTTGNANPIHGKIYGLALTRWKR